MAAQFNRKKSKRVSTRTRVKIEKKVREHNRKLKKGKLTKQKFKRSKKDPGVPNSCPFKEQLLIEAEKQSEMLKISRKKELEKKKLTKNLILDKPLKSQMKTASTYSDLVRNAREQGSKYAEKTLKEILEKSKQDVPEHSKKHFFKEFRKVVEAADVVLQVLDARDPQGSRCQQVEESVIKLNKKLVLVLNKIDLVPTDVTESWLKHLRAEFPTVAFKASTQTQRENLGQKKVKFAKLTESALKISSCIGADMLMKLLANYTRNQDIKMSVTVGVVGYPNTGKSSLINSLKRSRSCNVGAMPGITRVMQEVQLDRNIKLIDSPGVVLDSSSKQENVLRNVVKIENLSDPFKPVTIILQHCDKDALMMHYSLPQFKDINEFLALLAKKSGKLKKGGVPDVRTAAKKVLNDWNVGKITYYTRPPEKVSACETSAAIVPEMSEVFDVEALASSDRSSFEALPSSNILYVSNKVGVQWLKDEAGDVEMNDVADANGAEAHGDFEFKSGDSHCDSVNGEENGDVELKKLQVAFPKRKAGGQVRMGESSGVVQLNTVRKRQFKQSKKKIKKQLKRKEKLAGTLKKSLISKDTDNYTFKS